MVVRDPELRGRNDRAEGPDLIINEESDNNLEKGEQCKKIYPKGRLYKRQ